MELGAGEGEAGVADAELAGGAWTEPTGGIAKIAAISFE
jgi:hypothetical protein